jgi:hypothetical protein
MERCAGANPAPVHTHTHEDAAMRMGIFSWLTRKKGRAAAQVAWHEQWARAVRSPDPAAVASLEAALHRQPPLADDLELEEEMLDALRQLVQLSGELDAARLPTIDTSHRLVGADVCHFSAAVSVPDDPAQPTGRLLLTSRRAAFAGGGHVPALAWHVVRHVVQDGRDVLFVPVTEERAVRFRCNSFADAVCGAAIARFLLQRRRGRVNG